MKRTISKKIISLVCAGLLLCTPQTFAFAAETVGAENSTSVQTTPSANNETNSLQPIAPPTQEITPPVDASVPPVDETTPPVDESAPSSEDAILPTEGITPPAEVVNPDTAPPAEPPTEEEKSISYTVEIAWDSLEFDYTPIWNPDEHCYDGWKSTENPITIKNMTADGAPVKVTLNFAPTEDMGIIAVFSPCEGDPSPDEFELVDGQISFMLPRKAGGETEATINLSLSGDPVGWDSHQYNQIGSITTEIAPLNDVSEETQEPTPPSSLPDAQATNTESFSQKSAQTPPTDLADKGEQEPRPNQLEEEKLIKQEDDLSQDEQEIITDVPPVPENIPKEQLSAAPPIESGAPPQEEPQ